MPDDNSKLVPPLPIPNRTVKRLRADDSAATSVKVGHRQAVIPKTPLSKSSGVFYSVYELIVNFYLRISKIKVDESRRVLHNFASVLMTNKTIRC